MKQSFQLVAVMALLVFGLSGCGQADDPVSPGGSVPDPSFTLVTTSGPTFVESSLINGYVVTFDGRTFANNQTTFSYTVSGTGAEHALSNFFLEVPGCAPAVTAVTPAGGAVGLNPLTDIYGVKWDISLGANGSRSYSMTFAGDVPQGAILASVKAGEFSPVGEIAGPCAGFSVSGTVYTDADLSGAQNGSDEPGIPNVTVELVDAGGSVLTSTTDVNGDYGFHRISGTYTVHIDTATAAADFNEVLASDFDPTGPTSTVVTIGPDSPGNDFGYDPRVQQITLELDAGLLLTTGEGPKYWLKQLRGSGKTDFDSATMAAFLSEIEGLFLPEPFQFTAGSEFQDAINILKSRSKDPIDQLLKQLLAAELNEVSGKGLVDAAELQSVLLAWVESLITQSSTAGPSAAAPRGGGGPQRARPTVTIDGAIDLLKGMNGSATGGGGSGGEG